MAKGLRSKVKRRLRSARRHHYMENEGKQIQQKIASRLHNPYYDLKTDCKFSDSSYTVYSCVATECVPQS